MTQQPSVRSSYQPVCSKRSHLHIMCMIMFHLLKAWPASGTATNKSSSMLQCAILTPALIMGKTTSAAKSTLFIRRACSNSYRFVEAGRAKKEISRGPWRSGDSYLNERAHLENVARFFFGVKAVGFFIMASLIHAAGFLFGVSLIDAAFFFRGRGGRSSQNGQWHSFRPEVLPQMLYIPL